MPARLDFSQVAGPRFLPVRAAKEEVVVDVDVLLASVNNDGQLLVELSAIFSNEAGPIVENIKEAARTKQYEALEHAAHKLKGCISIFGA